MLKVDINENDIMIRMQNIFQEAIKSQGYVDYIKYLIKNAAEYAVEEGPQDSSDDDTVKFDYFTDRELAKILIEFRALPPLPQIINGYNYTDEFLVQWCPTFGNGYHPLDLLREYYKKNGQSGQRGGKKPIKKRSTKKLIKKRSTKKLPKKLSKKRPSKKRLLKKRPSKKRHSKKRPSKKR
jgi:hypothetical protein